MKFGTHVSIAGGVFNAPENAKQVGCETFQMFTRSPRGGAAPELTPEIVKQFKNNCQEHGFKNYYVHAPYYVNLASDNPKIAKSSIRIIREELERSSKLDVKALMIHVGSARDQDRDQALTKAITGITQILKGYTGSTQFLIEIAAGSGNVIGDTFEEVNQMISAVQPKVKTPIGVCFDTAHAFASGYDLRTKKDVETTFEKFNKIVGLKKLVLIHGNDSKVDFDSHVDRHWHIGKGKIGTEGFKAIINHPKLRKIDMILETPDVDMDKKNLKTVRDMQK
ncbi:MAG: endonuclease [Parcubacteria group bacterium]|nr:endonuclease [Parcubacteria group bacterium]|tara:strand:- start:116 stop:955 length:840 start_codon:yes stop_codon:yes gene_type:complete